MLANTWLKVQSILGKQSAMEGWSCNYNSNTFIPETFCETEGFGLVDTGGGCGGS